MPNRLCENRDRSLIVKFFYHKNHENQEKLIELLNTRIPENPLPIEANRGMCHVVVPQSRECYKILSILWKKTGRLLDIDKLDSCKTMGV